jgi:hypothetical protein
MGAFTGKTDISKLSKEEKIKLVNDKLDEVKKELGPNFAYISKTRICEMVQERLPSQPMYDVSTINMIMNKTYK